MSFRRLALAICCAGVLAAQVVPDWYVLELAETPAVRARGDRRIRESQTRVRTALSARMGRRTEVKDSIEVVMNALIVRSSGGVAELSAIPGVRRVWPVYEVHPELDRAAGLHQLGKAWEAVGGAERAGAGVKIGILDSGLDLKHPAFQTDGMAMPQDYPRATNEDIRGQLNNKVIVYRTYDRMLGFDESASDDSGHGTAVAMAAAGLRVESPRGVIQGAAPGAWLGIYKVFVGPNGTASNTAMVTKALDDAAADGMDVLNVSFGFLPQARPDADPLVPAVERAASLGLAVVKSNGNSGPARMSGSTPSIGSSGITVGANWTDRIFSSGVRINGGEPLSSVPGDGPKPEAPVTAPLKDVSAWDETGLACNGLPEGSLTGAIALIFRGECLFETKLNAAQAAGAVGVIVYTHESSPEPSGMGVGSATIPAVMIGHADGLHVKAMLAETPDSTAEMAFDDTLPFLLDSNGISDFSSRGPGPDGGIRPDVLAVGEEVLTAAQKNNPDGELYDTSGFKVANGTSFASPIVAGAYAVVKAARPGLDAKAYQSLLVNTAQPFPGGEERPAPVQVAGAGRMDVFAALSGRLAVTPVSVSFGMGSRRVDGTRRIIVKNVSDKTSTWKVETDSSDEVKATVEPAEFSLGPSDSVELAVTLSGDVAEGETQGFVLLRSLDAVEGERPQRVAYWYGAPTGRATVASVIPSAPSTAAAGSTVQLTMLVTDAIGASAPLEQPIVTVLEGAGDFVEAQSLDFLYPGYWLIRLRVGPESGQTNRFRVEFGPVVREVSIRSR